MQLISNNYRRFLIISIITTLSILSSGCSSSDKQPEVTPVELGTATSIDTPEAELLRDAQRFYNSKLFTNARETFEKIKDGYPFGPYVEYSEIKIADCYFYGYDYPTASLLYSEFAKQRPASPNLPYALVQMGRSYELQYGGLGRDTEPLNKSIEAYKNLLTKAPTSVYSDAARSYLKNAQKKIIASEKRIIKFYKKKDQKKAVTARVTNLKEMKESISAEDAKIDSIKLSARPTVEVPKLFEGPYDASHPAGGVAKASLARDKQENEVEIKSRYRILKVTCQSEKDQIFLYLNNALSASDLSSAEGSLNSKAEVVSLKLPETSSQKLNLNCMTDSDLTITQTGEISLKTTKTATIIPLSNPSRLLIALE